MSAGKSVRVAKVLRVIREGAGSPARLEIDGEPFTLATIEGFSVHPKRGELPSVTLSIAAYRVELIDDAMRMAERDATP